MADWPHSPLHRLEAKGTYIVTAGTLGKEHYFRSYDRLTLLHDRLLALAEEYGWLLQAWAAFSNHYHFVAVSPDNAQTLRDFIRRLHSDTARKINEQDGTSGRQVWFEYRDTQLTYERSYLARLNYVQQNPVKHGLVAVASQYPWCSAAWFERHAAPAFYKRVTSLRTDQVNVPDAYEAVWDR
jgi:putative transposase